MYTRLFNEFLMSNDSLQVYEGDRLLVASDKDRLVPLLEYIDRFAPHHQQVVIAVLTHLIANAMMTERTMIRVG